MAISFTVDGSWSCNNRGTVGPIEGARVEFWQQVSSWVDWFDRRVGVTYTDSNGNYSASFTSGHRHNFYARLVLNDDQGARLHNWWTASSWSINAGTGSNTSGNIHHDLVISKGGGTSTPKCSIWQGARAATQEYRTTIDSAPPDADYDISLETTVFPTPWSTLSTTHWPDGYTTIGQSGPFSVNFHEFSHTVRHSLDGDFLHFLFDAVRFVYARTHDPTDCAHPTNLGFAFNEGWAEFWATDWGAFPPAAPCDPTTNMELEGNVAAALYALSQCPGVGRAGMVGVLRANPGSIHSFDEFASALVRAFPQCGVTGVDVGETTETNVGEQIEISVAERRAATLSKIEEQVQVTTALRISYDAAVAAASNVDPCHTVEACDGLFQTVTGPSLLAGQIAQSQQVCERLQKDLQLLDEQDDDDDSLIDQDTYTRHLEDQRNFDQQTFATVISATQNALSDLEPFVQEDATGTLAGYVAILMTTVTVLENLRYAGMPPPESLQPPGAMFGESVA